MNEQNLREMIYEFGQRLSELRYGSSGEAEKVDRLLHADLMHYDKALSEAILRLILRIRFEDFDDETELFSWPDPYSSTSPMPFIM